MRCKAEGKQDVKTKEGIKELPGECRGGLQRCGVRIWQETAQEWHGRGSSDGDSARGHWEYAKESDVECKSKDGMYRRLIGSTRDARKGSGFRMLELLEMCWGGAVDDAGHHTSLGSMWLDVATRRR